jgi:hypothetical protein
VGEGSEIAVTATVSKESAAAAGCGLQFYASKREGVEAGEGIERGEEAAD